MTGKGFVAWKWTGSRVIILPNLEYLRLCFEGIPIPRIPVRRAEDTLRKNARRRDFIIKLEQGICCPEIGLSMFVQ